MANTSNLLGRLVSNYARIDCDWTRPANTTAYAAGKVMADATSGATMRTFSGVALRAGGAFRIAKVIMYLSSSNVAGSMNPDLALHLFSAPLATPLADGANFDFSWTDMKTSIGVIPIFGQSSVYSFNVTAGEGVGAAGKRAIYVAGLDEEFICAPTDTAVYGVLECLNNFTPVSADSFRISLFVEQK